jgi:hypothetical protein
MNSKHIRGNFDKINFIIKYSFSHNIIKLIKKGIQILHFNYFQINTLPLRNIKSLACVYFKIIS